MDICGSGTTGRAVKSFYIYERNIFVPRRDFYIPGARTMFGRVRLDGYEFCHEIAINELGFRGPSVERHAAPGVRTVVTLGDSYTANFDVPFAEAWPAVLEQLTLESGRCPVRVLNLGLTGAGPLNWVGLRRLVAHLKPDLIMVGCYEGITRRPVIGFVVDPRPRRIYCRYGPPYSFMRSVGICDPRFPSIPSASLTRYAEALEAEGRAAAEHRSEDREGLYRTDHAATPTMLESQHALQQIATWAPRLLLASFPSQAAMAGTRPPDLAERAFLQELAVKTKSPFIDLRQVLQGSGSEIFTPSSQHWNARGNRLVAEALLPHVRASLAP